MKKVISTVTLASLAACAAYAQEAVKVQDQEYSWEPTVALKVGYENQYIFRGLPLTDEAYQTQGKATWNTSVGDFQVNFFNSNPINSGDRYPTEFDYGLGYATNITDSLFVIAGYTYYTNKNTDFPVTRANEVYVGLGFQWEGLVLKATYFYDWNREQNVYEGDASYTLALSQLGLEKFKLEVGASVGYVDTQNVWADQVPASVDISNTYSYLAGRANIIYTIGENTDLSVGVRYAANNDHDNDRAAQWYASDSQNLWWGASVGINF